MNRLDNSAQKTAQKSSGSAFFNTKKICGNVLNIAAMSMLVLGSFPAIIASAEGSEQICEPGREVVAEAGEYLSEDGTAIMNIDEEENEFVVCEFANESAETISATLTELPTTKSAVQLDEQCPDEMNSADYKECYGKKLTNSSSSGKTYSIGDGFYLKDVSKNSDNQHEWVIFQGDITKGDGVAVGRAYVPNGNGGIKGGDIVDNGLVENGDNIFFIELNPGISVVVRLQERNIYEYWQLTAGSEMATFTLKAQSQDYWLGGAAGPKKEEPVTFCSSLNLGDVNLVNQTIPFAISYGVTPEERMRDISFGGVNYGLTVNSEDFSSSVLEKRDGTGVGVYTYELKDEYLNVLGEYEYTITAYVDGKTSEECTKVVTVEDRRGEDPIIFCENLTIEASDVMWSAVGKKYSFKVTSFAKGFGADDNLLKSLVVDFGDGSTAKTFNYVNTRTGADGELEFVYEFEHTYKTPGKYEVKAELQATVRDRSFEGIDNSNCGVTVFGAPNTGFARASESGSATASVGLMPLGLAAAGAMLIRRSYKKAVERQA